MNQFTERETSEGTSRSMRSNGRRDTKPALALRSELHSHGRRFRIDYAQLAEQKRRRGDIVFPCAKGALFVDESSWHGCPEHASKPKSNTDY